MLQKHIFVITSFVPIKKIDEKTSHGPFLTNCILVHMVHKTLIEIKIKLNHVKMRKRQSSGDFWWVLYIYNNIYNTIIINNQSFNNLDYIFIL